MSLRRPALPYLLGFFVVLASSARDLFADDCNANGVGDEADIAAGTSRDCNKNAVPDECDLLPTHVGFARTGPFRTVADAQDLPGGVVTGDFNGDRFNDVLALVERVGSSDRRLSILLSDGGGKLAAARRVLQSPGITLPAVADLNGDGNLDLAIGSINNGSFLEILAGKGDGTFTSISKKALQGNAGVTAPADMDSDGDIDLLILNELVDGILLLKNTGRAAFTETVLEPAKTRVDHFYAVGDFDGDHDVDFFVLPAWRATDLVLFRNRGDATFQTEAASINLGFRAAPLVADFDYDGNLDLLAAEDLLVNIGDGTLSGPYSSGLPSDPYGMIAADFDADADADVIYPLSGGDPAGHAIVLARNRGNGTFSQADRVSVEAYSVPVAAADLNGDDVVDFVAESRTFGGLFVLLGTGATLSTSQDINANRIPDECELDCDRDAIPDAHAIAVGAVRDCNHNGIPDACDVRARVSFERSGCLAPGPAGVSSFAAADLNADGALDLAFLHSLGGDVNPDPLIFETGSRLEVYINGGGGALSFVDGLDFGAFVSSLDAADLDNDGFPEIVAVKSLSGAVLLLQGDGSGHFEIAAEGPSSLQYARTVKLVDLNVDGLRDIIVEQQINDTYAGAVILQESADQVAAPRRITLKGELLSVIDLQGDGAPDLLTRDAQGAIWGSLNDGMGIFRPHLLLGRGALLAFADFDGDGDPDLVVDDVVEGAQFTLLNRGDATFEHGASVPTRLDLQGSLAFDVDSDGDMDLAGGAGAAFWVLLGDGKGAFSPATRVNDEDIRVTRTIANDFDGDGLTDLALLGGGGCLLEVLFNRTEPATSKDADRNGLPDECGAAIAGQIPSDGNQDGRLDLSDAIWLVGRLFSGAAGPWPCSNAIEFGPGPDDVRLLDTTGDGALDISDPIGLLQYLFLPNRPPPALGISCVGIAGCPDRCSP